MGNLNKFLTVVDGKLGVNKPNPQTALDVNGAIKPGYTTDNVEGAIRYNSTSKKQEYHNGTEWKEMGGAEGPPLDVPISAQSTPATYADTDFLVFSLPAFSTLLSAQAVPATVAQTSMVATALEVIVAEA